MKVLTIKNPWASLIVNNYKKYEFRSWKTNYRGKILIHAGLSSDDDTMFSEYNLEYIKGAIIGEADLVDCILVAKSFDDELKNSNTVIVNNYSKEQLVPFLQSLGNRIKAIVPNKIEQLGIDIGLSQTNTGASANYNGILNSLQNQEK